MGRPDGPRDPIAGPDTPEAPFPLKLRGPVIKGFGRGSKELGIPTANIPLTQLSPPDLPSGIYYGWCTLDTRSAVSQTPTPSAPEPSSNHAVADLAYPKSTTAGLNTNTDTAVYPTVLSIGYNPYYKNQQRSVEIHMLHHFEHDFYGAMLSLVILGFIRPEYDYVSKEALVEDIREDIRVAQRSLEREAYGRWRGDAWLHGGGGEGNGVSSNMGWGSAGQKDGVVVSQMID
ncbi:riboflavin kinase [Decorospora gaudefroyi]|uniref:Riboflavin kinase n=1 Tax=Decorospora gaudefroyi TaxID=184978 RepID=A0A6A5JY66_9PLEO|nr:riboflavin kinase [Decorospora gaudefroyi]